jgi:hypothetical protein
MIGQKAVTRPTRAAPCSTKPSATCCTVIERLASP